MEAPPDRTAVAGHELTSRHTPACRTRFRHGQAQKFDLYFPDSWAIGEKAVENPAKGPLQFASFWGG